MRFEKIPYEEWVASLKKLYPNIEEEYWMEIYKNIKLPCASTSSAAGHDFYIPYSDNFYSDFVNIVPTGIRWITEPEEKNYVLLICPRSGLGTKYGMSLTNTIGVIDSDYHLAKNYGHIMASITCKHSFALNSGDRFMQGIIVPFVRCGEDNSNQRIGGFGSTGA